MKFGTLTPIFHGSINNFKTYLHAGLGDDKAVTALIVRRA
jgi:hypothetical protein